MKKILIFYVMCFIFFSCSNNKENLIRFSIKNASELTNNVNFTIYIDSSKIFDEVLEYSDISEHSFIFDKKILHSKDKINIGFEVKEFLLSYDTSIYINENKIIYFTFNHDSIVKSESQLEEEKEIFKLKYDDSLYIPQKVIINKPSVSILINDF